jgi:hypothetical protein
LLAVQDRDSRSAKGSGRGVDDDPMGAQCVAVTGESCGESGSGSESESSEEDGLWTPEDREARKAARKVRTFITGRELGIVGGFENSMFQTTKPGWVLIKKLLPVSAFDGVP